MMGNETIPHKEGLKQCVEIVCEADWFKDFLLREAAKKVRKGIEATLTMCDSDGRINDNKRPDGKYECLTDDWLGDKPCPYCRLRGDIDLQTARGVMPQKQSARLKIEYKAPGRRGSYGGTVY